MLSRLRERLAPRREAPPLAPPGGFVDIHAHVIPAVDDGPQSWDESMRLLKAAAAGGTSLIVATPHGDSRAKWKTIGELRDAVEQVNQRCREAKLPLSVVLGMENPLDRTLSERLKAGTALTANKGSCLLVEFPYTMMPLGWEDILFQLQLGGMTPIIVHPERQVDVQKDPQILGGAVARGVLVQVTAGSLTARFGSKVRATAETLLRKGLVHILASDTHAAEGVRGPNMAEGYAAAVQLLGAERASRMVSELPRSLVGG